MANGQQLARKVDSLLVLETAFQDSLQSRSTKTTNKLTDSLQEVQQSIQQPFQNAGAKLDSLSRGVQDSAQTVIQSAQQKVNKWEDKLPEKAKGELPAKQIPELTTQGNKSFIKTTKLENPLPQLSLPEIPQKRWDIPEMPALPDSAALTRKMDEWKAKLPALDSAHLAQYKQEGVKYAKNNVKAFKDTKEALQPAEKQKQQMQSILGKYKAPPEPSKAQQKAAKLAANAVKAHSKAVSKAITRVTEMKRSYKEVNLLDPNGPVKVPLDKKPKNRWAYGLGFQLHTTSDIQLELAPFVGYKWNKHWLTGIGGTYSFTLKERDTVQWNSQQAMGYRFFTQYKFYQQFFAHLEWAQQYRSPVASTEKNWYQVRAENPKMWIGAGWQYTVYKHIKAQTQVLYNVLTPEPLSGESRWAVRVVILRE